MELDLLGKYLWTCYPRRTLVLDTDNKFGQDVRNSHGKVVMDVLGAKKKGMP